MKKLTRINKVGLIGIGISIIVLARNHANVTSVLAISIAIILFASMLLSGNIAWKKLQR